jgi:hypothetical protein
MAQKITVYEPGLPNTRGWATLSEAKREWLQEKTSNIKKFGAMEGLASVSAGIELMDVKNGLKGEEMGITDYIRTVWGEKSERTGFRKLQDIEELAKQWPADLIKHVSERGALLLRGTAGIGIKDLVTVSKELPAPKEKDDKTYDAFIENKVRAKLKENRAVRRTGRVVKLSDDDAMKILFNTGRRIMRAAKNLHSSADNKNFLKTVVGWWMEDRGVPGTLECKRISIPDGTVAQVGRPRKRAGKMVAGIALLMGSGTGLYYTMKLVESLASSFAAN